MTTLENVGMLLLLPLLPLLLLRLLLLLLLPLLLLGVVVVRVPAYHRSGRIVKELSECLHEVTRIPPLQL